METKELTLYGLTEEIAELLESDEPESLERLESLLPALEGKAAAVAHWIERQEDLVAAIRAREALVVTHRKALEAKAERSRSYLLRCMELAGVSRIEDASSGTTIRTQANPPKVVITDEAQIPSEFWRQPEPPPPAIDKRALGAALKAGSVPGAHAEQSLRLVIA